MRLSLLAVMPLGFVALSAAAQEPPPPPMGHPHHHHHWHHPPTGQVPVDHGPYTPDANRAYQGGGVILQGPPGAPPPVPQATPPGQAPVGSVPQ